MREFYRSWKRKAGCVTLVVALVSTGVWVRSRTTVDVIVIWGKTANCDIISGAEGFLIVAGQRPIGQIHCSVAKRSVEITILSQKFVSTRGSPVKWDAFQASSLVIYPSVNDAKTKDRTIPMVPYWSIVTPLTLLSAWLLLSKSRPPKRADHA